MLFYGQEVSLKLNVFLIIAICFSLFVAITICCSRKQKTLAGFDDDEQRSRELKMNPADLISNKTSTTSKTTKTIKEKSAARFDHDRNVNSPKEKETNFDIQCIKQTGSMPKQHFYSRRPNAPIKQTNLPKASSKQMNLTEEPSKPTNFQRDAQSKKAKVKSTHTQKETKDVEPITDAHVIRILTHRNESNHPNTIENDRKPTPAKSSAIPTSKLTDPLSLPTTENASFQAGSGVNASYHESKKVPLVKSQSKYLSLPYSDKLQPKYFSLSHAEKSQSSAASPAATTKETKITFSKPPNHFASKVGGTLVWPAEQAQYSKYTFTPASSIPAVEQSQMNPGPDRAHVTKIILFPPTAPAAHSMATSTSPATSRCSQVKQSTTERSPAPSPSPSMAKPPNYPIVKKQKDTRVSIKKSTVPESVYIGIPK